MRVKLGLDELPLVTGDIAALGNLRCLRKLGLDNTGVTGDIASLRTLTNLESFALYQTQVGGDIKSLQHLRRLHGVGESAMKLMCCCFCCFCFCC